MIEFAEQVSPAAIESEEAVIGAMIAREDQRYRAQELVCEADLYRPVHQDLFRVLSSMVTDRKEIDLISVTEELRGLGLLEPCGGVEYLMALIEKGLLTYSVDEHCRRVKHASNRRSVIAKAAEIIGTVQNEPDVDPVELITEAALGFDTDKAGDIKTFEQLTGTTWQAFDGYHSGKAKRGIQFGIDRLDHLTYGVCPGDFVIIGGRPSEGKTVLATQLCVQAGKAGVPVLFFSSEMSGEEINERALIAEARIDGGKARSGQFDDDDWQKAGEAANTLYQLPVFIDDLPASTTTIVNKTRRSILKHKIGLVIVDYLQLIECPGKSESRNVEVGKICSTLKRLTRSTGVPIVALAQLNRLTKREKRKPQLIDLREGGNMEGDADKVILIHNPHLEEFTELSPDAHAERVQAQLLVAKHRGGPKGVANVWFAPSQTRFDSCDQMFEEPRRNKSDAEQETWWA